VQRALMADSVQVVVVVVALELVVSLELVVELLV
jgi:hypothetical protein